MAYTLPYTHSHMLRNMHTALIYTYKKVYHMCAAIKKNPLILMFIRHLTMYNLWQVFSD